MRETTPVIWLTAPEPILVEPLKKSIVPVGLRALPDAPEPTAAVRVTVFPASMAALERASVVVVEAGATAKVKDVDFEEE